MAAHKIRYSGPGKNLVEAQMIGRVGKLTREGMKNLPIHKAYPLVYVCSPYADDPVGNVARAKVYAKYIIDHEGAQPVVPHLLYPAILGSEEQEGVRQKGLDFGMNLLRICSKVYVFRPKGRASTGMAAEIREAVSHLHIPVSYIYDDKVYKQAEEEAAEAIGKQATTSQPTTTSHPADGNSEKGEDEKGGGMP